MVSLNRFVDTIIQGDSIAHTLKWGAFQLIFMSFSNEMVSLFFLASGFGLFLSAAQRPRPLGEFYLRRFLRVTPLYWVALGLAYMLFRNNVPEEALFYHIVLLHTFTQYAMGFGALWFVGYIMQLYLVSPLLFRAICMDKLRWPLVVLCLVLYKTATLTLGAEVSKFGVDGSFLKFLDVFVLGMVLAWLSLNRKNISQAIFSPAGGSVALVLLSISIYFDLKQTLTIINLNVIFLVIASYLPFYYLAKISHAKTIFRFVSSAAYVVFLVHMPLYIVVIDKAIKHGIIDTTINMRLETIIISLGQSMLLAAVIFTVLLFVAHYSQRGYDLMISRLPLR